MGLPVPGGVSGSGREKQFTGKNGASGVPSGKRTAEKMAWFILCVAKRVSFRLATKGSVNFLCP